MTRGLAVKVPQIEGKSKKGIRAINPGGFSLDSCSLQLGLCVCR